MHFRALFRIGEPGKSPIELIQTVLINPVLRALEDNGAPVERHMRAVGLDAFNTRDEMSFLPTNLVMELLDRFNKSEFSEDAVGDMQNGYRLDNLGYYGEAALNSPTLLAAITMASDPRAALMTYNSIELEMNGPTAKLIDRYYCAPSPGQRLIENLSVVMMLDAMVQFAGPGCRPIAVDVTGSTLPDRSVAIDLSKTRIRFGQPENRVEFQTVWLTNSALDHGLGPTTPDWAPNSTITGHLMAFFDGLEKGFRPNLSFVAECSDMSGRTIQRRLAEEGTSFFDLLDQWSFRKAVRKLEQPDLSISEIAEELGYSYPAHFSRSFQRWTGQSATKYRENLG